MTAPILADVVIVAPDYTANHAEAIAHGDVPVGAPAPVVKYHVLVPLHCSGKGCPNPEFTASFPEVQRILVCPACGREVFIPDACRGTP